MKQPTERDKKFFQKAMDALNTNESGKAIKLFSKVRKSWGENADLYYLEGLAYGKLGKVEEVYRVSRKALKLDPRHFGAMCNIANAYMGKGVAEKALEYYEKALEIKPGAPEVMDNYGRSLAMLGRREESIEIFLESLKTNGFAPTHAALGKVYAEAGQIEKAKTEFDIALQLDSNLPEAHVGKGIIESGLGALELAEYHFDAAIKLERRNLPAYIGQANIKRYLGDYDAGLECIKQAEKLLPSKDVLLMSIKSLLLEQKGDKDEAFEIAEQLVTLDSPPVQAVTVFSKLCVDHQRCDEAFTLIDETLERVDVVGTDRQSLLYAAGDLADKLKRYDDAMAYYKQANSVMAITCDREKYNRQYNEMRSQFSKEKIQKFKKSSLATERPIFIVGMPRSGTTLTEQILASHPDVFGAGELYHIKGLSDTIKNGPYVTESNFLLNGSQGEIDGMSADYLGKLAACDAKARFVVDKMPHNFMHLGLISALFPEAKIIHCRRDPLDNALSIYFQAFIWVHDYASDFADLGFFYRFYDKTMRYWESVLDIPVLTVQYEDMIEDQETQSRRLLEFCGLEWDDSVLEFHKSGRSIGTASYDQVRRPIYKSSKERWRNYEKFLQPLRDELSLSGD